MCEKIYAFYMFKIFTAAMRILISEYLLKLCTAILIILISVQVIASLQFSLGLGLKCLYLVCFSS